MGDRLVSDISVICLDQKGPWAKYGLIMLAAIPMIVTMAVGCFFVFTNPDRLQSEEFVLKQLEFSIAERKGLPPPRGEILAEDDVTPPGPASPSTKEELR